MFYEEILKGFKNVILNPIFNDTKLHGGWWITRTTSFGIRHSSYQIVMGYRWRVAALLVKVCKHAQGLLVHSTGHWRVALVSRDRSIVGFGAIFLACA